MGYYTHYSIHFFGNEEKVNEYKKDLLEAYEDNGDVKELVNCGYTTAKLYDIRRRLYETAFWNPDVLVILNAEGEDALDVWEVRIKGQEYEEHRVEMPPFTNPELLLKKDTEG